MSSQDGHKRAVQRLIAIAGMLGSDHDGERANAARLATIDLRQLGLTWRELIELAFKAIARTETTHETNASQDDWEPRERSSHRPGRRTGHKDGVGLWAFVRHASLHRQDLSPWDIGFLETFLAIGPKCTATEAQWTQIRRIADKLEMAA